MTRPAERPAEAPPLEVRVVAPEKHNPEALDKVVRLLAKLLDTPGRQVG